MKKKVIILVWILFLIILLAADFMIDSVLFAVLNCLLAWGTLAYLVIRDERYDN